MKQARDPTNLLRRLQDSARRGTTTNRTTFTEDDDERKKKRIGTLISSKKGNKFKLPEKKELATRVLELKNDIEADILSIDPAGYLKLDALFEANIETISSKKTIKNLSNESAAQWFVNIFPIVDAINSGLGDLRRAQQDAARSLRQRANNSTGLKFKPTEALYKNIIDIMTTIDNQVGEAVAISGSNSMKSFFLKRLPSMLGRMYDASRRPKDLSLICCVLCRHMSIIHPPEDDGHVDRNTKTLTDYETRSAVWSKYVADRQEAIQNSTPDAPVQVQPPVVAGKTLSRAPSKPSKRTLEQPTSFCTCLANYCGNPNDDVGSSCPILCRTPLEDDFDMSDPLLLSSNPFAVRMGWVQEGPKTA